MLHYDDRCKLFLQVIMNEGALLEENANVVMLKIFNDKNIPVELVVNQINRELSTVMMMIQCSTCEVSGLKYYVLASLINDEMAKYQTEFTASQLGFLRKIFLEIITSPNGFIRSYKALGKIGTTVSKMPKEEKERFLKSMVDRKWLSYKNGQFYIGPRSSAELLPFFKETYPNLSNCQLCSQVIFYGLHCVICKTKIHLHCIENFASGQEASVKNTCPECKNEFVDVLEEELPETEFSQLTEDDSLELTDSDEAMDADETAPPPRRRRH